MAATSQEFKSGQLAMTRSAADNFDSVYWQEWAYSGLYQEPGVRVQEVFIGPFFNAGRTSVTRRNRG